MEYLDGVLVMPVFDRASVSQRRPDLVEFALTILERTYREGESWQRWRFEAINMLHIACAGATLSEKKAAIDFLFFGLKERGQNCTDPSV